MELEYHEKLEFPKIEFPISGISLYISETVIDCKIFSKTVLFDHFSPLSIENYGPSVVYLVSTICSRAVCHLELGNARPYPLGSSEVRLDR